jgi:DNA (cytosine-5)-methyltransferase 1
VVGDAVTTPILLDTFCGGGGCTRGYQMAGFYVVGVDIEAQPNYIGDEFIQADALEYLATADLSRYAVIHASPPCQRYSVITPTAHKAGHPDLIAPVRRLLQKTGKPFVIENVAGARRWLRNPIMLCGSMFGLNLWRHRYFEIWPQRWWLTPTCNHSELPVLITGTTRRKPEAGGRMDYSVQQCREASGLYWMTRKELDEAIPPAYTHWIGQHLMELQVVT